MGYSHYWENRKAKKADWRKACDAMDNIFRRHSKTIQYESNNNAKPVANDTEIRFNGVGEEGFETFCVNPKATSFDFCKTGHRPYDVAVCEVLIVLKHFCDFKIRSDGFSGNLNGEQIDSGWVEAMKNLSEHLGINYKYEVVCEREPYCDVNLVLA